MMYNFYLIIMFIVFIFIILEYSNYKNNFIHLFLLFTILSSVFYYNIWECNLFELNTWKLIFLLLLSISFFIIIELLGEKTFDVNCLLILVFLGSMILIISDNLLLLYLGLELQTFSIFILIAKNRYSIKSSEAGLKYFMLGAISSGFFLMGITILFLCGLDLNLSHLLMIKDDLIIYWSLILILISFCFKLGLFPFHFWIPDIYEGSSWDIITLISSLPKISVICVLIQILINSNIIVMFSLMSIIIGTLGALNQTKIKRLLGYSGISHIGFISLGLSSILNEGLAVGFLYLIIYMLTMLSLFILIINNNNNNEYIIELGGIKFINKIISITFVLLILSIAGIPPLSGFISKWYLIWLMIENQYNISSLIIILFSAIGIGYYLRIVKIIYFQKRSSYFLWKNVLEVKNNNNEVSIIILGFLFFLTLFMILNFSFIINFLNYYLISLF